MVAFSLRGRVLCAIACVITAGQVTARDGIIALSADDPDAPVPAELASAKSILHGEAGPFIDVAPLSRSTPGLAPKSRPPQAVSGSAMDGSSPTAHHPSCTWEGIGAKHGVSPYLLFAIAKTESSFNPRATNRNTNGSEDVGMMQINSIWLPTLAKFGIDRQSLFDGCVSLDVGAWILSKNMKSMGVTWDAVGAYNAKSPEKRVRYANKVYKNLPSLASLRRPVTCAPGPYTRA